MNPHHQDDRVTIHHGDALEVLRQLPDASVDAVVTDPPYGLEFMGKTWDRLGDIGQASHGGFSKAADNFKGMALPASYNASANVKCQRCGKWKFDHVGRKCECGVDAVWPNVKAQQARAMQQWHHEWAAECLRVLKPGGHMLAFGGTRTWHRLACAVEDAGFEVRDSIAWLYSQGFPKSLDVSKAIDKAAGAEREVIGEHPYAARGGMSSGMHSRATQAALGYRPDGEDYPSAFSRGPLTAPATPDAERWQGWGTALKPAFEPVVVARKPLAGTVAANVLTYGTGALNVDGCRITASDQSPERPTSHDSGRSSRGDSTTCTCPEPAGDRTNHTTSTPRPASSDASPEGRSGRPASARGRESGRPQPQGSQDGYPSSPRSGDGRAREAGAGDQAPLQPRPDAHTSPARCATCGRTRSFPSMPYPHDTAPHVQRERGGSPAGRWPTNVVLDDSQAAELDRQSGNLPTQRTRSTLERGGDGGMFGVSNGGTRRVVGAGEQGGASRFFPTFRYEAKAPSSERPRYKREGVVGGESVVAHPT